jgi:hypothetical protein
MGCNNNHCTCHACTRVYSCTGTWPRLLSHALAHTHMLTLAATPMRPTSTRTTAIHSLTLCPPGPCHIQQGRCKVEPVDGSEMEDVLARKIEQSVHIRVSRQINTHSLHAIAPRVLPAQLRSLTAVQERTHMHTSHLLLHWNHTGTSYLATSRALHHEKCRGQWKTHAVVVMYIPDSTGSTSLSSECVVLAFPWPRLQSVGRKKKCTIVVVITVVVIVVVVFVALSLTWLSSHGCRSCCLCGRKRGEPTMPGAHGPSWRRPVHCAGLLQRWGHPSRRRCWKNITFPSTTDNIRYILHSY